jgi:RsiW-degrading membrane proteinase PrsW (M82 family)
MKLLQSSSTFTNLITLTKKSAFANAFLIAACCEESLKFFIASRIDSHNDLPYSIVICSTAAAVGFATLENMMYIVTTGTNGSLASIIFTTIAR